MHISNSDNSDSGQQRGGAPPNRKSLLPVNLIKGFKIIAQNSRLKFAFSFRYAYDMAGIVKPSGVIKTFSDDTLHFSSL